MGIRKTTRTRKPKSTEEKSPRKTRQRVVKGNAPHPDAPKPQWEKPKRRRKVKAEEVEKKVTKRTKVVAIQYLFDQYSPYADNYDSARFRIMPISIEDYRYVVEGANAFVFIVERINGYLIRYASEKFVQDRLLLFRDKTDPAKAVMEILKTLRADKFDSALVTGDAKVVSIINGRRKGKEFKMTEAEDKAHKAASRNKLSAQELQTLDSPDAQWMRRQVAQMEALDPDASNLNFYEITFSDQNSLGVFTNKKKGK